MSVLLAVSRATTDDAGKGLKQPFKDASESSRSNMYAAAVWLNEGPQQMMMARTWMSLLDTTVCLIACD
jgi:hypothetical protein